MVCSLSGVLDPNLFRSQNKAQNMYNTISETSQILLAPSSEKIPYLRRSLQRRREKKKEEERRRKKKKKKEEERSRE